MLKIKSSLIVLVTFILIIIELTIGFETLAVVNIPRALIPINLFKISLAKFSNYIGDLTVYGLKLIMLLMHGNNIRVIDDNGTYERDEWYMSMSNHQ